MGSSPLASTKNRLCQKAGPVFLCMGDSNPERVCEKGKAPGARFPKQRGEARHRSKASGGRAGKRLRFVPLRPPKTGFAERQGLFFYVWGTRTLRGSARKERRRGRVSRSRGAKPGTGRELRQAIRAWASRFMEAGELWQKTASISSMFLVEWLCI